MPISIEIGHQPERLHKKHTRRTRRSLGHAGMALSIALTPAIAGATVNAPVAAADTIFVNDYPYLGAMEYNVTNYDWWMDENGNGVANTPDELNSPLGYGYRNCTDGAAYWTQKYTGTNVSGLGHAYEWDSKASMRGFTVLAGNDNRVEPGDIAQSDDGNYGHVGFVTRVDKDTSGNITKIEIAELNRRANGLYSLHEYSTKDGNGYYFRYPEISGNSQKWHHFIDPNGLGKGLNNTPTGLAMPETSGFGDPRGAIDLVRRVPGGVRMVGWAFDPDTPSTPISVDIYGGDGYATPQNYRAGVYANELNTLVGSTYSVDPYKGFTRDFTTPTGPQHLCMYGINASPNGTTRRNACSDITVSGQPIGNLDTAYRVPGGVRYEGWAIDPDTAQPIDVHLFESDTTDPGMFRGGSTASIPRTDLESALSGSYLNYSPNHGYATTLSLGGTATHHVCAFALNTSGTEGGAQKLGCKDVYVTNSPVGTLEGTDRMPDGTVRVAGWGFDPDVAAQGSIHIYSDTGPNTPQTFLAGTTTTIARPDVQAVFPGYDTHRGFAVNVAVPTNRRVCTYVLNADGTPGSNVLLGCGSV